MIFLRKATIQIFTGDIASINLMGKTVYSILLQIGKQARIASFFKKENLFLLKYFNPLPDQVTMTQIENKKAEQ